MVGAAQVAQSANALVENVTAGVYNALVQVGHAIQAAGTTAGQLSIQNAVEFVQA
jgi:hypothetical protein